MEYTHKEIISILSTVTADPEAALAAWQDREANRPVNEGAHRTFVWSFPVEVGGREVATVTLVDPVLGGHDRNRALLMAKYMGAAEYRSAYETFNHVEQRWCLVQVHEEFEMPEVVPGLEAMESHFTDAAGNRVAHRLMWGYPDDTPDADAKKWRDSIEDDRTYGFLGSHLSVWVEDRRIAGSLLGEDINRRIAQRARGRKIDDALGHEPGHLPYVG